ncbi:phage tail sheath subtilisin-like domain-containing protein [Azonexus sp. R2A61]|uniref:phage tail sheath subtilisin-like domain-containing protein n=1 Tax=Azonexus sp. R2A61 TaxID=2744443 RepID=UPI001F3BA1FD|nr:phage tail sheath subtilisin-like domain-containing protein [Azonexus sp. R2A61]
MASANVSFEQIPGSTRDPGVYFEFNSRLAVRNLPGNPQTLRLVGQKLVAGQAAVATPYKFFSDVDAAELFGYGSHMHLMTRAALKANPYTQICAIAVDDGAGSQAATGSLVFAGASATKGGSLVLRVGNQEARIAVDAGMTPANVAADLAAELGNHPEFPVAATATAGTLEVTARHKGTTGNDIKLAARWEGVTGLNVAVNAMTGGTGSPDIGPGLAAIQDAGDNLLVMPFSDTTNLTKLRDHLDYVGNGLEQRGASGMLATTGTYGTAVAQAAGINHGRLSLGWLYGSDSLPWEIAAAYGAVKAFEEDPARPLNGLELKGIHVPPIQMRMGRVEREAALHNGVTPIKVGPGERVQIVRSISTYTLNPQGILDPAWLDMTTVWTLDYVRLAVRQRLALRFPRDKRTPGVLKKIRSEIIDVLRRLEELEIVEEVAANLPGIVVEYDAQESGRVNVRIPVDVVNGLHVIAGVIDLIL